MPAAELDAALGPARLALVDSTAIIAFHSPPERAHRLADHVFRRIEDDDPLAGIYSVVTAAECLVRPTRVGPERRAEMQAFLENFPNLRLIDVDFATARQAATIRAATNLGRLDALIVAFGLVAGCDAVISNDEAWTRRLSALFPRVRWVYLDAFV